MTRLERSVRTVFQVLVALAGGAVGYVLGVIALIVITAYSPYPGYEPTWVPMWLYAVPAVMGAGFSGWVVNLAVEPSVEKEACASA